MGIRSDWVITTAHPSFMMRTMQQMSFITVLSAHFLSISILISSLCDTLPNFHESVYGRAFIQKLKLRF